MALYRGGGRVVFPFGLCCLFVFLLCVLPRALRGGYRREVGINLPFTSLPFTTSHKKTAAPLRERRSYGKSQSLLSWLLLCHHLVNLRAFKLREPRRNARLRVRVLAAVNVILGNHNVAFLQLLRLPCLILAHKLNGKMSRSACGLLLNDNRLLFPRLPIAALSRHQVGHYVYFSDCFHVVLFFVVCVFIVRVFRVFILFS